MPDNEEITAGEQGRSEGMGTNEWEYGRRSREEGLASDLHQQHLDNARVVKAFAEAVIELKHETRENKERLDRNYVIATEMKEKKSGPSWLQIVGLIAALVFPFIGWMHSIEQGMETKADAKEAKDEVARNFANVISAIEKTGRSVEQTSNSVKTLSDTVTMIRTRQEYNEKKIQDTADSIKELKKP
jgi:methyl-accepting chemotaxis protein